MPMATWTKSFLVLNGLLMPFLNVNAAAEAGLMISEKVLAFADAQVAAERGLEDGLEFHVAVERAYVPLRDRVRANSERLLPAAR